MTANMGFPRRPKSAGSRQAARREERFGRTVQRVRPASRGIAGAAQMMASCGGARRLVIAFMTGSSGFQPPGTMATDAGLVSAERFVRQRRDGAAWSGRPLSGRQAANGGIAICRGGASWDNASTVSSIGSRIM